MIIVTKVKCEECGKEIYIFLKDNYKIKIPFICVDCFKEEEIKKIRTKEYKLAIGCEIKVLNMFLGYKRKIKPYKSVYKFL